MNARVMWLVGVLCGFAFDDLVNGKLVSAAMGFAIGIWMAWSETVFAE